jgi:lactate dehydrogenase-like 2-hydroxyacid dehydrogenase
MRQVVLGDRVVRRGDWTSVSGGRGAIVESRNPEETTIGILGLGWIGRKVIQQLRGFGFHFRYYNRRQLPDEGESDS